MQPFTLRWSIPFILTVLLLPACSDTAGDSADTAPASTTITVETTTTTTAAPTTATTEAPTTTTTEAPTTTTLDVQSLTPAEGFFLGAAALILEESYVKLTNAEPVLARVGAADGEGLTWGEVETLIIDMGWELLDWAQIEQSEAAVVARDRLLPVVDVMERWRLALSLTMTAWDEFWDKLGHGDATQEWGEVVDGAGEVRRVLEEASSLLEGYGYAVPPVEPTEPEPLPEPLPEPEPEPLPEPPPAPIVPPLPEPPPAPIVPPLPEPPPAPIVSPLPELILPEPVPAPPPPAPTVPPLPEPPPLRPPPPVEDH